MAIFGLLYTKKKKAIEQYKKDNPAYKDADDEKLAVALAETYPNKYNFLVEEEKPVAPAVKAPAEKTTPDEAERDHAWAKKAIKGYKRDNPAYRDADPYKLAQGLEKSFPERYTGISEAYASRPKGVFGGMQEALEKAGIRPAEEITAFKSYNELTREAYMSRFDKKYIPEGVERDVVAGKIVEAKVPGRLVFEDRNTGEQLSSKEFIAIGKGVTEPWKEKSEEALRTGEQYFHALTGGMFTGRALEAYGEQVKLGLLQNLPRTKENQAAITEQSFKVEQAKREAIESGDVNVWNAVQGAATVAVLAMYGVTLGRGVQYLAKELPKEVPFMGGKALPVDPVKAVKIIEDAVKAGKITQKEGSLLKDVMTKRIVGVELPTKLFKKAGIRVVGVTKPLPTAPKAPPTPPKAPVPPGKPIVPVAPKPAPAVPPVAPAVVGKEAIIEGLVRGGIERVPAEKTAEFIRVVIDKDKSDIGKLKKSINFLSQKGMNKISKSVFTDITGLKIPMTTKAADRMLKEYTGYYEEVGVEKEVFGVPELVAKPVPDTAEEIQADMDRIMTATDRLEKAPAELQDKYNLLKSRLKEVEERAVVEVEEVAKAKERPAIYAEILDRGGIGAYKDKDLAEEIDAVPSELRGTTPLDEMAEQLAEAHVIEEPTEKAVLEAVRGYVDWKAKYKKPTKVRKAPITRAEKEADIEKRIERFFGEGREPLTVEELKIVKLDSGRFVIHDKNERNQAVRPLTTMAEAEQELEAIKKVIRERVKPELMQVFRMDEDTVITNTQGKKIKLPKGEEYRITELEDNKVRLQDGKQLTVYEGELDKLRGKMLPPGEMPKAGGMIRLPKPKRINFVLSQEKTVKGYIDKKYKPLDDLAAQYEDYVPKLGKQGEAVIDLIYDWDLGAGMTLESPPRKKIKVEGKIGYITQQSYERRVTYDEVEQKVLTVPDQDKKELALGIRLIAADESNKLVNTYINEGDIEGKYDERQIDKLIDLSNKLDPSEEGQIELFAGIPLPTEFRNKIDKWIKKTFDIEAVYKDIGAPETGLAIKTFIGKRVAGQEKTLKAIEELGKMGYSREDMTELAFLSERPGLFVKYSREEQHRLAPGYRFIRKYFRDYYEKLKDTYEQLGIEAFSVPFPQSHIRRLQEENIHLKTALKKAKKPSRIEKFKASIKDNQDLIDFYKDSRIQYVHLPVRLWLKSVFEEQPELARRIVQALPRGILGRETPTLSILVQKLEAAGIMKREDVDIRDIIAMYGRYVEDKLALADIFRMSLREGLIEPEDTATELFVQMPSRIFPELKGHKVHPQFAEWLENFERHLRAQRDPYMKVLAYVKMLQFYNPLFLPMYDVFQHGMLAGLRSIPEVPSLMKQAIRSVRTKDDAYFEASKQGLFSQPFANPFKVYMDQVNKLKKSQDNDVNFIIKTLQNFGIEFTPKVWETLYNFSWHTAWQLDKLVRMMSYNYLLNRGFDSKQAAQVAAKFHADYASVPAETRRKLNRIFFTPTFKIVMFKLYGSMLDGVYKTLPLSKGKPTIENKAYARGLLHTLAILMGKHFFLKSLKFKSDQFSRRYYKETEIAYDKTVAGLTKEVTEKKEIVLTFSNPANVWLRYYYRYVVPALDPTEVNKLKKMWQAFKWELHPVYQWGIELIENQGVDFKPIRNPFDDPITEQGLDVLKYSTKRIMRILDPILIQEGTEKERSLKAFEQEAGRVWYRILKPFVFPYLREPEERRKAAKIRGLASTFRYFFIQDPPRTKEEAKHRQERFEEMIAELEEDLKK